jgi:hypothetical protein
VSFSARTGTVKNSSRPSNAKAYGATAPPSAGVAAHTPRSHVASQRAPHSPQFCTSSPPTSTQRSPHAIAGATHPPPPLPPPPPPPPAPPPASGTRPAPASAPPAPPPPPAAHRTSAGSSRQKAARFSTYPPVHAATTDPASHAASVKHRRAPPPGRRLAHAAPAGGETPGIGRGAGAGEKNGADGRTPRGRGAIA